MRRHRADGASAVEFAILLPLLMLLVFGIIAFSQAYNRSQGMNAAVREGARLAALGDSTVDDIRARVRNAVSGSDIIGADVNVQVREYATAADADQASDPDLTGAGLSGSSTVCDDGTGAVRVAGSINDAAGDKYDISIPFFPSRSMDFVSFAVFRCQP